MSNHNFTNNAHGMKLNRHPIYWVKEVLQHYVDNNWLDASTQLTLSRYHYVPQSFSDYRQEFSLPLFGFNENTLLHMLLDLGPEYELAFHSTVTSFGQVFHIPMIDFGYKGTSPTESESLKELCRHWKMSFQIYASGRSFHAYGNRLLTSDEWVKFMGSLLLLNKPSGYKLIDERWVGHRIMGGYSALRFSKNTSHYKKFPTLCGNISGDYFEVNDSASLIPPPPSTNFNLIM